MKSLNSAISPLPPSSVPPEHQDAILKVIQTIGKGETKTAIKSLCPPEVTYQEIELVLDTQS